MDAIFRRGRTPVSRLESTTWFHHRLVGVRLPVLFVFVCYVLFFVSFFVMQHFWKVVMFTGAPTRGPSAALLNTAFYFFRRGHWHFAQGGGVPF